jgi:hypothetical protein
MMVSKTIRLGSNPSTDAKMSSIMEEYSFSVDFKHAHDPLWFHYFNLANLDHSNGIDILEVGTFEGNTATWFSDNLLDHPDSTLTCVDDFSTLFNGSRDDLKNVWLSNTRLSKNYSKISLVEGQSRYVLYDLLLQGKSYDLIFVDGSHHTPDVILDGILSFQLLRPNGLLIFDDDLLQDSTGRYPVTDALSTLKGLLPDMEPIIPEWANELPLGDTWEKLFTKQRTF